MCVCMYVCACVTALQPKRMDGFWWNFPQMIRQIFVRSVFLRFWNFQTMTSWRPFLHFFVGALSRSQFCSDFLQNWWRGRKLSSAVCYLKSARSVGNFRQYGEPRFRKKIKMASKNNIFEIGQVRCQFLLIQTRWLRVLSFLLVACLWNYGKLKMAARRQLRYNIILIPSDFDLEKQF